MAHPCTLVLIYILVGAKYLNKDDIESFVYLLINLAKGKLPWASVPIEDGDNYYGILMSKMNTTPDKLWERLPSAFSEMYKYIMKLTPWEKIDYEFIESLLHEAAEEWGFKLLVSSLLYSYEIPNYL